MVYIAADGTVQQKPQWSLSRLLRIITGFFELIFMFDKDTKEVTVRITIKKTSFKTLFSPGFSKDDDTYSRNGRSGGGPPGPPRPRRRIGGINTLADCSMPGAGGG